MTTRTVTQARKDLSNLISRVAFKGERITLRRNGKDVAALVPVADAAKLEALEDSLDLKEVQRRLKDGRPPLSYDEVRSQLDLK